MSIHDEAPRGEYRWLSTILCEDVTQEEADKVKQALVGALVEAKVDGVLYEVTIED